MRPVLILITSIFSFFTIDLTRFKARSLSFQFLAPITQELTRKKEKKKRRQKRYNNHKYKRKKNHLKRHYKLKGTAAKDKRFSNQKAIRRMFRND